jgi:hypothetical protein
MGDKKPGRSSVFPTNLGMEALLCYLSGGDPPMVGCILNLKEIKIPALSQKARQGRGTTRISMGKGWASLQSNQTQIWAVRP